MKRLPDARLEALMRRALAERGVPEPDARWVAEALVGASLRGIDTHGVRLFRTYLAELDGGRARVRPEISWRDGGGGDRAFRVMDAGGALGLVAGRRAVDEVTRLARRFGLGGVLVRGSNHFGAASCYSLEIAQEDQIGLVLSNSDALVAPWNGRDAVFGTNPLAVAAPSAGDELFSADLATSQVSYSKVKHHREQGLPLEPGWAVLGDDGEVAALTPLGNHKGQCLSMIVEILTAVLGGGPLDHELSHLYTEPFDRPREVSHLFLAIDLPAATDPEAFRARLARFLGIVRRQPAAGNEPVVVPGDPEAAAAARRAADGIPLTDDEYRWFLALEGGETFTQ